MALDSDDSNSHSTTNKLAKIGLDNKLPGKTNDKKEPLVDQKNINSQQDNFISDKPILTISEVNKNYK